MPDAGWLAAQFDGNVMVGGEIGDSARLAFTDFRVHADGCSRFVVVDRGLSPRQAGRMLQRLFEIEAYRMLALLALPVARAEGTRIAGVERALARLTGEIARDDGADESLLSELTRLAADVERALVESQFRFGASRAYRDLVRARIAELRERRLPGLQTIDEFMSRRLSPAMATCESVAHRLREMSERVAQASGLLSTRVEIAREKQNQALLGSMDRRAKLRLRLQQTVEGLSIAAVTYYVVGLVGYAAKAMKASGVHLEPDIAMGVATRLSLRWLRSRCAACAGDSKVIDALAVLATCRQGAFKPLYGAQIARDYPELPSTKAPLAAAPPAPAPVDPAQAVAVVTIDLGKFCFRRHVGPAGRRDATFDTFAKSYPAEKVDISAYHDAHGSIAQNQEPAKPRTFAVRDQLPAGRPKRAADRADEAGADARRGKKKKKGCTSGS